MLVVAIPDALPLTADFGTAISSCLHLESRVHLPWKIEKGGTMPRGDKSSYSSKQKREAEHIEKGYKKRGVTTGEAERRAWATVNKETGGGVKASPGRKKRSTAKRKSSTAQRGTSSRKKK